MTNTKRSEVRRLLIPPQFRRYVTRLRPRAPKDEDIDQRIIDDMIECLLRIRPRRQPGEIDQKGIVRSQLDRENALRIVRLALGITWKWIAEDQNPDMPRDLYRSRRKEAERASKLAARICTELDIAAARDAALRDMIHRPATPSEFDREILEQWLSEISSRWPHTNRSLPLDELIETFLDAWDSMHPIVRTGAERRLREGRARSIIRALNSIPALINLELKALKAAKLPHVRSLQRQLEHLFKRFDLRFGAVVDGESRSQKFVRLAQEAIAAQPAVKITRNHIYDARRREKRRKGVTPKKRQRSDVTTNLLI